MEVAGLVIAIAAAVAAVASAVFAGIQAAAAKADRTDAEKARDEARTLAAKANDSFERQALAQERANEIQESLLPRDEVRWELENISGNQWCLRNIGNQTAEGANLKDISDPAGWIRFDSESPRDVPKRDFLDFLALSAFTSPTPRVQVRWRTGGGPLQTEDFTIAT
jgi:hypothetical protein